MTVEYLAYALTLDVRFFIGFNCRYNVIRQPKQCPVALPRPAVYSDEEAHLDVVKVVAW